MNQFGSAHVSLLGLVCLAAVFGGCAALNNYPDRSNDVAADLSALKEYFNPGVIKRGGTSAAWRDEVVNAQVRAIDLQFTSFEQALARENVGINVAVDMAVIGLGAATGVVGGAGLKSILGVVAGGLTGAKGIIDKDVFYSKTMPVLLAQMEAQRKVQLVRIRTGLKVNEKLYPLAEAVIDVEEYYKAGSIPGALQGLTEQAGAAGQNASKELRRLTAASGQDVVRITAVRERLSVLFNTWSAAPASPEGKKAIADAKAILAKLRPNNQLDGRPIFDALDEEVQQANPGSEQLTKVNAAFSTP